MNKTIEGMILSSREYRDYDVILRVLCKEEGYQSFIARGVRKLSSKNAGACQPFTYARFYVDFHEGKQIHTMRTADVLLSYRAIREDLKKQSIATVICECMEKCDMEEGFAFVKETMDLLAKTTQDYGLLALFFSCMNQYLGIEPYVDGCVRCHSHDGICAISIKQGGFICNRCAEAYRDVIYPKEALKCFRLLCKASLQHFAIIETYQNWNYEHFLMIYQFFEEYSGIQIKSMKFLSCLEEMKGRIEK